jgi:hypothetical protein
MKQSSPPRAATWVLQHLTGGRNDALAGDLLEEFHAGRSAGWYWRQVVSSIVINYSRNIRFNGFALLFAGLWALLAPMVLPTTRLGEFPRLDHVILNLAWPWSALCEVGLSFSILISFVWIGLLLYLLLVSLVARRFSFRRLRSGVLRSAAVFAPLYVGFRSLTLILPGFGIRLSRTAAHHPLGPTILAESVGAPFFITLLWAIWDASRSKNNSNQLLQGKPGQNF